MLHYKLVKPFQIFGIILAIFSTITAIHATEVDNELQRISRFEQLTNTFADDITPIFVAGAAVTVGAIYYFAGSSDVVPMTSFPCVVDRALNLTSAPSGYQFYVNSTTLHTIAVETPSKAIGWFSKMLAWLPECHDSARYKTQEAVASCLARCIQPLVELGQTGSDCLYLVKCWSNGTQTLTCDMALGAWRATHDYLYTPPAYGYPLWFNRTNLALSELQHKHPLLSFHWDIVTYACKQCVKWQNGIKFWGL